MSSTSETLDNRLEQLNVLYALCLAVILTFTFRVVEGPPESVELAIAPSIERLMPVVLLLLYFLFDWLSWNALLRAHLVHPLVFMGTMTGILSLSIGVLCAYSVTPARLVPAAVFLLVAAAWDVGFQGARVHRKTTAYSFVGLLIAAARVLSALLFLSLAVAPAVGTAAAGGEHVSGYLCASLAVVVVLKCTRMPTLRR